VVSLSNHEWRTKQHGNLPFDRLRANGLMKRG
jgi:hypothetical protein